MDPSRIDIFSDKKNYVATAKHFISAEINRYSNKTYRFNEHDVTASARAKVGNIFSNEKYNIFSIAK